MQPTSPTATLAEIRRLAAQWNENAARTRAAGTEVSLGWRIDRMEERDDIATALVDAWQTLDEVVTRSHGLLRPDEWFVPPLTAEQFDAALADWPELSVFGPDQVKELSRHHGIRTVRAVARDAVKNLAVPAPASHRSDIDPAELDEMGTDLLLEVLRDHVTQLPADSTFARAWHLLDEILTEGGPECLPAPWDGPPTF